MKSLKIIFALALIISGSWLIADNGHFGKVEASPLHVWEVYTLNSGITGYKLEYEPTLSDRQPYYRTFSGYESYTFDSKTGYLNIAGNPRTIYDAGAAPCSWNCGYGPTIYSVSGQYLYRYSNSYWTGGDYSGPSRDSSITVEKVVPINGNVKGSYIGTTTGTANQFPNNGEYNGKWYVYKGLTNNPTITITTLNGQTLSKVEGFNKFNLMGNVKDVDFGDSLTIKYSIDGVPSHQNRVIEGGD